MARKVFLGTFVFVPTVQMTKNTKCRRKATTRRNKITTNYTKEMDRLLFFISILNADAVAAHFSMAKSAKWNFENS